MLTMSRTLTLGLALLAGALFVPADLGAQEKAQDKDAKKDAKQGQGETKAEKPKKGESEFPADWFYPDGDKPGPKPELRKLIGKPMPLLDLSDWVGDKLNLKTDLKGKIVVVDIWATWCGPCIAAIPHNNEVAKKYEKDVVVLGVCSSGRGQEKLADVAKEKGIAYPVARDPKEKTSRAWKVSFFPTYGVVDRKGKLRALGLKADSVDKVIEHLLAEDAPADAPKDAPAKTDGEPKEAAGKGEAEATGKK